jgi:hypothetical protein
MSSFFDIIASTIVFGVLTLTVARVQTNMNSTMYENQFNVVTQTNAVELARQFEWDFLKIGHHVSGQKILWADSTGIRFLADLQNNSVVNDVTYYAGDTSQVVRIKNPKHFPLFRRSGVKTVQQNWGLTYLRITYYDGSYQKIQTPITTLSRLQKIKAIDVAFRIESSEPVYSLYDTTRAAVAWEKTIVPRNLDNLNY